MNKLAVIGILACIFCSGCVCSWGPGIRGSRPIYRGIFAPLPPPPIVAGNHMLAPVPYYRYYRHYHYLPYRGL